MSTRTPKSSLRSDRSPCLLVIRDGWGSNPHPEHDAFNAVHLARTPVADDLAFRWPTTLLRTSGPDVGLPEGADGPVMGNSEVGHQNIGAGRIVDQELMRISRSIEQGSFFENAALDSTFGSVESTGGTVHLLGLISDGQVHSDLDHVMAVIEFARRRGVPADRLAVHAITDGRDTPPTAGRGYVARLEQALSEQGYAPVASVMGRYWAMDRDNRWDRIERAWHCLVTPPDKVISSADEALGNHYAHPEEPSLHGDEFVPPVAIGADLETARRSRITDGDSVLFMNFRGDRPRELTKAFVLDEQAWSKVPRGGFDRVNRPENLHFTGLTRYEEGLPIKVAFEKPEKMPMILGETIARAGMTQLRCAETEKFPHVTFFFNDYREHPFEKERRVMLDSPTDVLTYDQKPEMSAFGVRDAVLDRLAAEDCEDLIIVNFANGDMVGHTGSLDAAVRACEVVDECVGKLVEAALERGASLLITADHGNAEQMWNPEADCPHTAHTNFDVPVHLVGELWKESTLRDDGRLADIAPTILELLAVEKPAEMSGRSLIT
ncbi:MAG: 2,3-bisphosphoglycerate-independent phosphoglycerate mutase [Phycisphaerales bacterium]|nr:2,3-bisphosphoglycerate-independent phosphoglycerate mutase [Phycisphaerales bacterium]